MVDKNRMINYVSITMHFVYIIAKMWPSMHYGNQEDANEFYIGFIKNLIQTLPKKVQQHYSDKL